MDSIASARLMEERKNWRRDLGFLAKPSQNKNGSINLFTWDCAIPGREGSIWEGGLYKEWKPATTLRQVLLGIQALLDEPNLDDPAQENASRVYCNDRYLYETIGCRAPHFLDERKIRKNIREYGDGLYKFGLQQAAVSPTTFIVKFVKTSISLRAFISIKPFRVKHCALILRELYSRQRQNS